MPRVPVRGRSDVYVATGEATNLGGRDVPVAPTYDRGCTPIGANP
jgi:hypothetical protein